MRRKRCRDFESLLQSRERRTLSSVFVVRFRRSGGWLDFFLVDSFHEIEGICEKVKKVEGRGGRVRVRVRLREVEFVVVVGVRVP